jgi:hypothetical protein
VNCGLTAGDWKPTFADYLFVSLASATASSPTDAMPYSRRAKLVMGISFDRNLGAERLDLLVARQVLGRDRVAVVALSRGSPLHEQPGVGALSVKGEALDELALGVLDNELDRCGLRAQFVSDAVLEFDGVAFLAADRLAGSSAARWCRSAPCSYRVALTLPALSRAW